MPSNHLILCHPLLLPPSISPSIRVFSNESTLVIRWSKYWSFSFNISPSNEHLTDFVGSPFSPRESQESSPTPPFKSINSSVLSFLYSQLSHRYMTTGKTIALTSRTFVGKVMSLLLNMLTRLVINFLPRSKHLLISWLQSPSAVILEPKKIKSCHGFHCFPICLPWSDGTRCHDLSFLNFESELHWTELPISVVWPLSLILKNSQPLSLQTNLSLHLFP